MATAAAAANVASSGGKVKWLALSVFLVKGWAPLLPLPFLRGELISNRGPQRKGFSSLTRYTYYTTSLFLLLFNAPLVMSDVVRG